MVHTVEIKMKTIKELIFKMIVQHRDDSVGATHRSAELFSTVEVNGSTTVSVLKWLSLMYVDSRWPINGLIEAVRARF